MPTSPSSAKITPTSSSALSSTSVPDAATSLQPDSGGTTILLLLRTWTSLISRLSRSSMPLGALDAFARMRRSAAAASPNHFTFSAALHACAATSSILHGSQLHSLIHKHGFARHVVVATALLDAYAKCSHMDAARSVFDEMPHRNLVTWNALIAGFLRNCLYHRALGAFKELLININTMRDKSTTDQVSFSSALSACANVNAMGEGLELGRQLHGIALKHGATPLYSSYVNNSLLDMYGKCGSFPDAVRLFRSIGGSEHCRDVVAWNVMVMGCVHHGDFEEACAYFRGMRREGISPDEASFSSALHAAAGLSALNRGTLIHDQIIKMGFAVNACVSSSLVTMYAKCGSLVDSYRVFREAEDRSVVCWTAMIAAFQQHGRANEVIALFEDMLQEGIAPNCVTFVCVLSACSHAGRVEQGFAYFDSMTAVHSMSPGPEHYACIVDLLGRAGRLQEAKSFAESMPIEPGATVWGALLGACRNHGDIEKGKEVAEKLFEIEPDNSGNYVLLSNMYARCGRLKEADEVRKLMGVNRVRKEPGCSWIDVKGTTFVFTVHDRSHSMTDEIYEMLRKLEELVGKKGYVAVTQFAVNCLEEYKERSLWYHSEKLALAFGLLVLPPGAPVRINKNLRTCGDCHLVMKFASEIFGREIIVRDINRFHRFSDGSCSCSDYW